ncbi:hypothetical protein [Aquipuribacter hungaricus]|uniref:Uncharacterized protein n=1 Tax=Aquipuribacter hungaricus TaxID=545624 RepID=A0ABV7WH73_9MICO
MSAVVGLSGGAGSLLALLGVYLDDAWHTDVGRDGFFSPPHLLLYAGVLVTSLSVLVWVVRSWRQAGGGAAGAADVLRSPAIWLAGVGGVTTVLSAPLDDAWHRLFGRDAVLWSPPHLAAVAGTCALAVGLLAGLQTTRGRGAGAARVLAAAAVVGSLQVPVLEYDSDVPQFSPTWYLPVAAIGVCLALVIVEDLFPGGRALVQVAVVYTVVRVLVVAVLAALGSSLTIVAPVGLALGLAVLLRGTRRVWRLLLVGAAVPLLWWPALVVQEPVGTSVAITTLPWRWPCPPQGPWRSPCCTATSVASPAARRRRLVVWSCCCYSRSPSPPQRRPRMTQDKGRWSGTCGSRRPARVCRARSR